VYAARAALDGQAGVVQLAVVDGRCAVLDPDNNEVVNLA
jgi:hypothetical protein